MKSVRDLPCDIDDVIYVVQRGNKRVVCGVVTSIHIMGEGNRKSYIKVKDMAGRYAKIYFSGFGIVAFFNEAEALEALEKLRKVR